MFTKLLIANSLVQPILITIFWNGCIEFLVNTFKDISSIYKYLGGNERFRALAYERAYKVISSLPNDITFYYTDESIKKLKGIGDSISEKIIEFLKTGKIKKYEEIKKNDFFL